MKVLHVIPSLSITNGGPSLAILLMVECLHKNSFNVQIATTIGKGEHNEGNVASANETCDEKIVIKKFSRQLETYKVSFSLFFYLFKNIKSFRLIHIHSLFSFSSTVTALLAYTSGIPYIVRPLGVLNNWGMQNRRPILKKISFLLIEKFILKTAAALHFTSVAERLEAEKIGAPLGGHVIPIGINSNKYGTLPDKKEFVRLFPITRGREIILFLSRLDEKKGLDILLPAFCRAIKMFPAAMLVLAGNGSDKTVEQLKNQAYMLGIEKDILWTGFLEGNEKLAAFSSARLFILPSYSENFGIALVEAMAAGLPCIATEGVAVSKDMAEFNAGVIVKPNIDDIATAICDLLADPIRSAELGARAKKLVSDRFSLDVMGESLKNLYERVIA